MSLVVTLSEPAKRDIRRMDRALAIRIMNAIQRYAETGLGDVRALKGHPGEYRIRVGDYRIRYTHDPARFEMIVQRVQHRREAYR